MMGVKSVTTRPVVATPYGAVALANSVTYLG
jgi:hypothetical protein